MLADTFLYGAVYLLLAGSGVTKNDYHSIEEMLTSLLKDTDVCFIRAK